MMATAQDAVSLAESQVGVTESPANSNKVTYWNYYKQHCGVNYQGQPWCAAFVTYIMSETGQWSFTSDEARFRYCPSLVSWAKKQGSWKGRSYTPKAGDIILFANKGTACHVGLVVSVSGSTINTIEGNTSVTSNDNGGAVMRRERTLGTEGSKWYILGYVANEWKEEEVITDEDIEKIANKVWEKQINGYSAADRIYLSNKYDYDTTDPTGRGMELTTHDHTKYIAAKLSDTKDEVDALNPEIEEIKENVAKLLELLSTDNK
jgi:hypothetical protein